MRFLTGNLLESGAEALVNTVNTVGVMGKGIALMFKEQFPANYRAYANACERGEIGIGHVFATRNEDMYGPKWIINFPTKKHWRHPSKLEWIEDGLRDLRTFIVENGIKSVAIPPLGAGNGGLEWRDVRQLVENELSGISGVDILVYEPTEKYQNVAKRAGVEKLTPARALIAELVRRYSVLGIDCTLLELQKLAWFASRVFAARDAIDPLNLKFKANKFGPYADQLRHMLDALDGSYLQSDKRISDSGPFDTIRFVDLRKDYVATYLKSAEAKDVLPGLEATAALIEGFESPLGLELLATVDWLLSQRHAEASVHGIRRGINKWPGGAEAATRKAKLFDDRVIEIALERLVAFEAQSKTTDSTHI